MKEEGRSDSLFEDPDFPAEDTSLFCDRSTPVVRLQGSITWLRPQKICPAPTLFPDDINLAHSKQGLLGDCWFLCACAFLLKNKHLLNKVLLPDQPQWGDRRYRGSFKFCFWQHGCWTEVTVDDRLPCINSALCFSRCHSLSAFWVALLEKAYAKLHGSYERLWAGQVSEALVDLTGGLAERCSLGDCGSEEEQRAPQDSGQVRKRWLDLQHLHPVRNQCALSCSTNDSPEGACEPGQYHALTVMEWLDVDRVSGDKVQLLRIRNPWGRCCWGGVWIESGVGWNSVDPSYALELQSRATEGEFWLDEGEFLSQFNDITIGYPITDEGHLRSIYSGALLTHSHQLAGRWTRGHSAGGSRNSSCYGSNPKFWLRVCDKGEVVVSLLQQERRRNSEKFSQRCLEDKNTKHQHYQAIALHMWKVDKKRFSLSRMLNKPPSASTHCHTYVREAVLHEELEPGHYLMIPSIYQPGVEARFLIRVFSSSPTTVSALKMPATSLPLPTEGEWETSNFQGLWVEGRTAGGSRNFLSHWQNPNFPFTVCDESTVTPEVNVRITLQQNRPDTDLLPIGFHIYKLSEGEPTQMVPKDEEPVASCVPHCYTQDVCLACRLPPGAYTIVPSTYQPDCSASFTLSLACRIHRKVVKSQERLGRTIQEISHISLMQS